MATINSSNDQLIAERIVFFSKAKANSILKITYEDTMGIYTGSTGTSTATWKLYVDGSPIGRMKFDVVTVNAGINIYTKSLTWYVSGVSAGTHNLQIGGTISGALQLIHGNPNGLVENSITVFEINP